MPDGKGHLSPEEIFLILRTARQDREPSDNAGQEHLARCAQCGMIAGKYREVMDKLDLYRNADPSVDGPDCPPAETWVELAAGLLSTAETGGRLEHAAICRDCSARLQEALEVLGSSSPPPAEIAADLKSSDSGWQSTLAKEMARRSRKSQENNNPSTWRYGTARWKWTWAAIAAGMVIAAGVAAYMLLGQATPEKLLAQAYTQQRTIELRIHGASYGPIRVQRDRGHSQLNSSGRLLDAEVVIKRRLEKQPEAPEFLREKAEVDLLNWDYQSAIETLGHALRLQPQSFLITLDLATAHFERAEATNSPADYEASLNYLGDAIRLEPSNSAALFNRAIVYERLYLYGRAIEDWDQFLKVEKDPGWRKEAQQRLQELRTREHERSQRPSPESLSLAQFTTELKTKRATGIEEYTEVAERRILPNISALNIKDPNYQAAIELSKELEFAHGDRFLKDLLRDAGHPGFAPAVKFLGRSSAANYEGHSDQAYTAAVQAAAIFRKSGNTAGLVAAGFEQAYALQFQSKAAACQALSEKLVKIAVQQNYVGLNIQLRLEQTICANMNGELGLAKNLARQALGLAQEHGYESFYLRGLTVLATLESEGGDESTAWSAIQEGLGLYWKSNLPAVRAYSIYALLARMAQYRGHPNVQLASAFEALDLPNPSRVIEASERMRLADAALQLGQLQLAESQSRKAEQVFAAAPQTDSVRWRELEIKVWLAQVAALQGSDASQAAASLIASLPEMERLSNRYPEFQYYSTLAELRIRSGDDMAGRQFLARAIQITEDGLKSLPTWRERLSWMNQHRTSYVTMVELLLRSGDRESALNVWEHFRTADQSPLWQNGSLVSGALKSGDVRAEPFHAYPPPETPIITYAFNHDGLTIWVRRLGEVHSVDIRVTPRNVWRAAENLIGECSRPDSDMSNLRADAQYLYKWLIQPVRQWLPASGHIIVEPDGILGIVPFEVLIDDGGSYLEERYSFTVASSVRAKEQLAFGDAIHPWDRALIAAAPAGPGGSLESAPGASEESFQVARRFDKPLVLDGGKVQVSRIGGELPRSAIFHFAGHAGLSRTGAAMLMADGILGADQARTFGEHKLNGLKLAVFSACGTAKPSEISDSESLVTAFLQAGARNVVASRWNVDSMATADFIDLFYGAVLSGATVTDALRSSEATFRKTPERSHPYYWAAFAAFGEV